jgi:hypothetical protein
MYIFVKICKDMKKMKTATEGLVQQGFGLIAVGAV